MYTRNARASKAILFSIFLYGVHEIICVDLITFNLIILA